MPQTPADAQTDATAEMQARLHHVQRLYREWTLLLPRLQAAQLDWARGDEIMRELSRFYFGGGFLDCRDAIDNGALIDLRTEGEHSVLAEDTLWNALHDQRSLAWQRLRAAVEVLDRPDDDQAPHKAGDT